MNIVYFSHSYRGEDAKVVGYFAQLLQAEQLVPSLDPPSKLLNSAKLERHLNCADGMVAILTRREDGVSPHILYEISLCRRARKPLLIFVEDTLPSDLVPAHCMQRRFSRRSFIRHLREDRNIVNSFRSFVRNAPPRFQPVNRRKACLLVGCHRLREPLRSALQNVVASRGYDPLSTRSLVLPAPHHVDFYDAIGFANVAIVVVDAHDAASRYALGALHTAFVPVLPITSNSRFEFEDNVPREYQPRSINGDDVVASAGTVNGELDIFEQDFVDLDDQSEVDRYVSVLLDSGEQHESRSTIVNKIVLRDQYNVGQAGAAGPGAAASEMSFDIGKHKKE